MYKEIIFIPHCFVLSWCFPDPYVFRLTVCFSADPAPQHYSYSYNGSNSWLAELLSFHMSNSHGNS